LDIQVPTISFLSKFFLAIIYNHLHQLEVRHCRQKKHIIAKVFVFWILEGFCSMDATSKDGSKVDLAKGT
jgi:hypothetical protein